MFHLVTALLALIGGAPMQDAGAPCVTWHGEARMTGYGFRHVVVLKSACKVVKSCDVSTDVNPEVQKVSIAPNETKEVVTFLEAVGATFTPRVVCK
jgi:hypothetical protein